jgi:hypothetical protein
MPFWPTTERSIERLSRTSRKRSKWVGTTARHPIPRFAVVILYGAYRQYSGHPAAPIGRPNSTRSRPSGSTPRISHDAPLPSFADLYGGNSRSPDTELPPFL